MADEMETTARRPDPETLARVLGSLAIEAGRGILEDIGAGLESETKGDGSPVTQADKHAECIILAGLSRSYGGIPTLSEESIDLDALPDLPELYFLIDPLDGTRDLLCRAGGYTVNIALIEKDVPIAGAVYAPAFDRLFVTMGDGRAVQFRDASRQPLPLDLAAGEPLQVARRRDGPLRALVSNLHKDPQTLSYLESLRCESTSIGSSFKFCLIAAGEADLYPRFAPTMEWDTAAGQAVLVASGGAVVTLDGQTLGYNKRTVSFRNPPFIARGDCACPLPLG